MKRIGFSLLLVWFVFACNRLTETSSDVVLSNDVDYLNFLEIHPSALDTSIYVSEELWAKNDTNLTLSLGSDDGFTLWLNGDSITSRQVGRGVRVHDDLIDLTLNQGRNTVRYRIDQRDGGWGLWRNWLTTSQRDSVLHEFAYQIYSDVVETSILPDSVRHMTFNLDPRRLVDNIHQITLQWEDVIVFDGAPKDMPQQIDLPTAFNGFTMLSLNVRDTNGKVVFAEHYPIWSESGAETMRRRVDAYDQGLVLDEVNRSKYSTRKQAELFLDLRDFVRAGRTRPGPRLSEFAGRIIQHYRPQLPVDPSKPKKLVVLLHAEFDDSVISYWNTYAGRSHALMADWTAASTRFRIEFLQTLIPADAGSMLETARWLAELIRKQNADEIAILAWSKSAFTLFEMLPSSGIPVTRIGWISPWLPADANHATRMVLRLKQEYPRVSWHIFHGVADTDVPLYIPRLWRDTLLKADYRVDYSEVPWSSHWHYVQAPEHEFLKNWALH